MIIERTHDMTLVREIMTHKSIYKHLMPDNFVSAENFNPVDDDLFYYLLPKSDGKVMGIIFLSPLNMVLYQGHVALLPEFYGQGIEAVTEGIAWLRRNTDIAKLLAFVAEDNGLAKSMLEKTGFYEQAIIEKSVIKRGNLMNLYLMGYDL